MPRPKPYFEKHPTHDPMSDPSAVLHPNSWACHTGLLLFPSHLYGIVVCHPLTLLIVRIRGHIASTPPTTYRGAIVTPHT